MLNLNLNVLEKRKMKSKPESKSECFGKEERLPPACRWCRRFDHFVSKIRILDFLHFFLTTFLLISAFRLEKLNLRFLHFVHKFPAHMNLIYFAVFIFGFFTFFTQLFYSYHPIIYFAVFFSFISFHCSTSC